MPDRPHHGPAYAAARFSGFYAAYFLVAGGVITDIGGMMGHGSIVAREVGIPCVANARDATRRLKSGDRVRIDGTTGAIEVLARAGGRA